MTRDGEGEGPELAGWLAGWIDAESKEAQMEMD